MAITVLKHDRAQYYSKAKPHDTEELDLLSFDWLKFKDFISDKEVAVRIVRQDEVSNLPLISYRIYGSTHMWWIIAMASDVIDPFSEVTVGKELIVPALTDVESYIQLLRVRSRSGRTVDLPVVEV